MVKLLVYWEDVSNTVKPMLNIKVASVSYFFYLEMRHFFYPLFYLSSKHSAHTRSPQFPPSPRGSVIVLQNRII